MEPVDAVDRDRLLQTFLELVGVDSPTGHEELIGSVLDVRLSELGCVVSRDDLGTVVAVLPGNRGGTVLLSTHMDTAWTGSRVVPVVGEDGVVRSDGSTILGADDKAGVAQCLELLTVLQADPDRPHPTIELVFTVGEERGQAGSRHLDRHRLQATHGFVLDAVGEIGSIVYWPPCAMEFPGEEVHQESRPFREAAAAIRSLGLEVSAQRSDRRTDADVFWSAGIPCVALPTGAADPHTTAEHIAVDDLVLGCQVLVALVTGHDHDGLRP